MNLMPYIRIARPDNWFKNVFVLPGILLAYYFSPGLFSAAGLAGIVAGFVCACLVASSNYVLNEILDAPTDRLHPVKRARPIPSGEANVAAAYWLWAALSILGLVASFAVNRPFGLSALALWVMGVLYNVRPVRLKEWPYLDVLSEAVNNPIRLALGWFSTGLLAPPPLSMIVAYWMFGSFLMAVKRLAELLAVCPGAAVQPPLSPPAGTSCAVNAARGTAYVGTTRRGSHTRIASSVSATGSPSLEKATQPASLSSAMGARALPSRPMVRAPMG